VNKSALNMAIGTDTSVPTVAMNFMWAAIGNVPEVGNVQVPAQKIGMIHGTRGSPSR